MSTPTRRSPSILNASADVSLSTVGSEEQNRFVRQSHSSHPYRRFSHGAKLSTENGYLPSPAVTPLQSDSEHGMPTAAVRDPHKYSNESGTDADDEAIQCSKALPMATMMLNKGYRAQAAEDGSSASGAGKDLVEVAQSTRTDSNVPRRFLELVSSMCICGVVLCGHEVTKTAYFTHRGVSNQ